jgi:hypothetical protein
MNRVVMGPSKIEGRICPRTRVEDRGRYLGIPRTERFRILACPGNRVRYRASVHVKGWVDTGALTRRVRN